MLSNPINQSMNQLLSHQWTNRLHRYWSVHRTNSGSTRLLRSVINSASWRCEHAGSPEAAQMFEALWCSVPIKTSAAKLAFHLSTDSTVKKLKIHLNETRHDTRVKIKFQVNFQIMLEVRWLSPPAADMSALRWRERGHISVLICLHTRVSVTSVNQKAEMKSRSWFLQLIR